MRDDSTKPSVMTAGKDALATSKGPMATAFLAEDAQYYHYLLIKEISNIAGHLFALPLREYTYEEWNWFLILISRGNHHNISSGNLVTKHSGAGCGEFEEPQREKEDLELEWQKSYLRSDKTESQWMLEQLTTVLKRELEP